MDLSSSVNPLVSRIFVRELIRTTALRPVIESELLSDVSQRTIGGRRIVPFEMFEFLSESYRS